VDLNGLAAVWSSHRGRRGPSGAPGRRRATVLLLAFLALDLAVAAFLGGRGLARGLATADPGATGALLVRIPLGLGLAGALWEGGCLVDPAPFRSFLVRDRTLVLAEFLLGLTTPAKGFLAGLGAAFALGLGSVRPPLLPWGLLYTLLALSGVVCLERILHVVSPARFLHQRAFLLLLLVLGGALAGLRLLGGGGSLRILPGALERVWSLPGTRFVQALQAALAGRPLAALARLGVPLAAAALLGLLAWVCIRRAFLAGRRGAAGLACAPAWTGVRPWMPVAWIQFQQLLGSRAGQMRLLMLLLAVVLAKEPELISVGHLQSPRGWAAAAGALTFGAVLVVPLANLLGFDRGGVRTWWLLPLRDRDLLLGKVLGTAAYGAIALPILLGLLVRTQALRLRAVEGTRELDLALTAGTPFTGLQVLALALLLGVLLLWWAGSCLHRSLAGAWPMGLDTYGVRLALDDEKLARLGALLAPVLWMLPLYALADLAGPRAVFPLLAVLGVWAALRFTRRLDRACLELAEVREALTAALVATP
jgi:hypothetical protein